MTECIDHGLKGKAQGYAEVWVYSERGHHKMRAHRMIFQAYHGYLPPVVMHLCDNTRCINIDHLDAGDTQKNVADRVSKGRSGKHRPEKRKLSEDQVRHIRASRNETSARALASQHGVKPCAIYNIWHGKTYRDVV